MNSTRRAVLALVFGGMPPAVCARQQAQSPPTDLPKFKADADLVLVSFAVIRGKYFVLDVSPLDVLLLEDGHEQRIALFESPKTRNGAGFPLEVCLLIDVSGTVVFRNLITADMIHDVLVAGLKGRSGTVSVYSFAKQCRRLSPPSGEIHTIRHGIEEAFRQPADGTNLYEAVMHVCDDLSSRRSPGVRIMLLFSDGLADSDENASRAVDSAIRSGLRIFPVLLGHDFANSADPMASFGARAGEFRLKRFVELGRATGGRGFDPITPSPRAIVNILDYVVRLLSAEYIIGYYGTGAEGQVRRRRVEVRLRSRAQGKVLGGSRIVTR